MNRTPYIVCIFIILSFLSCDKLDISSGQSGTFIKYFGSVGSDIGNDVKPYDNGYLILATVTSANENTDIVLIKTDKFGNIVNDGIDTLSSVREGNNVASEILMTTDGGFIILGTVLDTLGDQTDIYIEKFIAFKESGWEKIIGSDDNERANAVKIANSGYIIAGSIDARDIGNGNNEGFKDAFLVKIDDSGNVEWSENYGGSGHDYAEQVVAFSNGYTIIGSTNSFNEPGQDKYNILVVKTNISGSSTPSDRNTYGATNNDYGTSLIKVSDGYLLLGTVENSIGDNSNILAVNVQEDIHEINWNKEIDANLAIGNEIIKSNDGYVIVGSKEESTGSSGYFIKIDSSGENIVENSYGGFGQEIYAIEPTYDGGFVMVGSSGNEGNEMICLIKVNSDGEL